MELEFLGTGAGVPSKQRNVTSIALKLLDERNEVWLFDCGEATQHQILHTTLKPRKISKIFISHLHGDHIFGLPGFLSSRSHQGGDEPIDLYGPKGLKEYVETSLKLSQTKIGYALYFHEIEEDGLIMEDESFRVLVKKLAHSVPSYGYRIEEKDQLGHLDAQKLMEDGLPAGPLFGQLKTKGQVEYAGKTYNREDYLSPDIKGRIITIIMDTRSCPSEKILAQGADMLIHEATFGLDDTKLAYRYFHSSIQDVASLAKEVGVKNLCLTHISSRYVGPLLKEFIKEAKAAFPSVRVVKDLEILPVERREIDG
ncbi:ribonuclease Z [Atopobacter sp. AH10]|uniref:ribonuclease Z n=1 Tax=Atopobacter sp. AH10 TaxID=2315861 RepID=UPI000EF1F0B1|nr:ribonuclease Z [Atopobacter sp. AH10]RLK62504.1 ribonuclease Z [Atopobacter sp. AH10]